MNFKRKITLSEKNIFSKKKINKKKVKKFLKMICVNLVQNEICTNESVQQSGMVCPRYNIQQIINTCIMQIK